MAFGRASVGDLAGGSVGGEEGGPDTSGEGARSRWRVSPETTARVGAWSRVLGIALGIGALAGAGQLGVAYGLGLLRFAREFPNDGVWSAQLTWVAWFAALAVLGGAAGGSWTARRHRLAFGLGARVAAAAMAGIGAAVVAPLAALPADSATVLGRDQPAVAAAVAAGLGVLVGMVTAATALTVRLVAVSVTLLIAVVWLLALISIVPWLAPAGDLPEVRLAVVDLPGVGGGNRSAVAVLSAPILVLLICGAIAAAARSRGLPPLPTAVATTAAPGLLALVYLIGSPGTGDRAVQTSAYAASLIAVAVGLLVSLLVGVARMPQRSSVDVEPTPDPEGLEPAEPSAAEPSAAKAPAAEPPAAEPSALEPPAWARFDEPAELVFPEASPVSGPPAPPVSSPPAWPAPAFDPEPTPLPDPDLPTAEPPASEPAAAEPAASEPPASEPPTSEPPASEPPASEPEPEPAALAPTQKRSRRLKLPRLGRRAKQPDEQPRPPEPPDQPEPAASPEPVGTDAPAPGPAAADDDEPVSPPAPPPPAPRKPGRRGEAEHLDWISSLAGGPEDEPESDTGRRRLRPDRDLGAAVDDLPEPPSRG